MKWKFIKDKGLILEENPNIILLFDQPRQIIRQQLLFNPTKNKGRADSEDDYQNLFDISNNWVRLGFDNDELFEIEILDGKVNVNDITVQTQANLSDTLNALKRDGFHFVKGCYSHTDFNAMIDIGDSYLNGGEENYVRWFYTAKNFDHLLT
ncbi:MAG TPA: hypothetical protein PLP23_15145 [Panacibacter sp.]|nr:hypothetical protein [Panacibacter sp.]